MPKTRLLARHKNMLYCFARENLVTPKEDKAVDAAYKAALKAIAQVVYKRYPPDDMAILTRYDVVSVTRRIRYAPPEGGVGMFYIKDEADYLTIPDNAYPIPFNAKTLKVIDKYADVSETRQAARDTILQAYNSLIAESKTFEDLVEAWPGAAVLESKICKPGTALSTLSDDMKAQIKKTNITEITE